MKRPQQIKVGPLTFTVKWKRIVRRHGAAGLTYKTDQKIVVDKGLPVDGQRFVLFHECLHALVWTYGFPHDKKDREEGVVDAWSAGMVMLLRDNPELVAFLLEP